MTRADVEATSARTAAGKVTVPYVLTLIAGVLVILNGLALLALGAGLGISVFGGGLALGVVGVLLGLVLLYSAIRLNADPTEHVAWGAVIILFSVISLVLVGGGFIMGFVLGLIAGILAIAWRV